MELPKQYMLDTNVFGNLVDGSFHLEDLPSDGQFWATPVQWAEIIKAPDKVQTKFKELIADQKMILAGFAFDIPGAGWGESEWRQDGKLWHALKKELDDALEIRWASNHVKEEKRKREKEKNSKDASIAEAAMFNCFTFITSDKALIAAAMKHGIDVLVPKGQSNQSTVKRPSSGAD